LSSAATFRENIQKVGPVGRMVRWLDAMPHPPIAIEIAWDRVAGVRWSRSGSVEEFAVEALPVGAIVPSAVEANIADAGGARSAILRVCNQLHATDEDAALLLPDPVIRVFVQRFDEFPRSPKEAIPLLRWKLKKSVPFEAADTAISYVVQGSQESGVDVVAVVARLRVIREYEEFAESAGLHPGVVLSSSLAALTLLEDQRPTLLARVSNTALMTSIVRNGLLCGYRCTELPARAKELTPQVLLDEIYPVAAYYQDTLDARIESVQISGIGSRFAEFARVIENEFKCKVQPLLHNSASDKRLPSNARPLVDGGFEGLLGWMLSR